MWRLSPGLIETRLPPSLHPPSISPNRDWLSLHPHGVLLIRTSLLPWWRPKAASCFSPACLLPLCLLASSWAWEQGGEPLLSLGGPVRGLASRPQGLLSPWVGPPHIPYRLRHTPALAYQKIYFYRETSLLSQFPALPSVLVPSGRECKINMGTRDLSVSLSFRWEGAGLGESVRLGLWDFFLS